MADTQTTNQTTAPVEAGVQKVADAAEKGESKAVGAKDSIINDVKKQGVGVLKQVKGLPKPQKAKFFVGMGLVFASLLSYVAVFWYGSKPLFLAAGVFYPIAIAAVTILSAYNQNDFFEALFAAKKGKKDHAHQPEVHAEDEIHETHHHVEVKQEVSK